MSMHYDETIGRYLSWYRKLLAYYPAPYRERFGEAMEQTFKDLIQERKGANKGLFSFALWMYVETSAIIIKENVIFLMSHKNIIRIAIVTACILLVPLMAMQFTDQVNWNSIDFIIMGALIFGTGLVLDLVAR